MVACLARPGRCDSWAPFCVAMGLWTSHGAPENSTQDSTDVRLAQRAAGSQETMPDVMALEALFTSHLDVGKSPILAPCGLAVLRANKYQASQIYGCQNGTFKNWPSGGLSQLKHHFPVASPRRVPIQQKTAPCAR